MLNLKMIACTFVGVLIARVAGFGVYLEVPLRMETAIIWNEIVFCMFFTIPSCRSFIPYSQPASLTRPENLKP